MHLSPKEIDKLMLHGAGVLAQKRYARGLRLNYVETIALISTQMLEFIRDGDSVAELMVKGKSLLGFSDVLHGVAEMIPEIQVEGTFPDGTKLVTVHNPVCKEEGEEKLALYSSGLVRTTKPSPQSEASDSYPGKVITAKGDLTLNEGRGAIILMVLNRGDRPVQVGSHYPFFEVNPALEFDRNRAFSCRLDIPAGTAIRFEPGETKEVPLVEIAGDRKVMGGNGLICGSLDNGNREKVLKKAIAAGFNHKEQTDGQ